MKNKLEKHLNSFIKDIENSAPNAKEKLKEIYPVKFKLYRKKHCWFKNC